MEISASTIIHFYKKALGSGVNPIMSALEITEKTNFPVENKQGPTTKKVRTAGTAVFKKDRLAGYLNEKQTRGLNWMIGEADKGEITMPSPINENKLVSVEIIRAKSKIKPLVGNGEISFEIEVNTEGTLAEEQSMGNITEPKQVLDYLENIKKQTEPVILKDITAAIEQAQKLKSDIFGFGSTLNKEYPDKWKEIEEDWNELFPEVDYTVKVNVDLERTGLKKGPFTPKE
jgi:spore germination protein KC